MTEHPDFDDDMFGDLLGDFLDESAQLLEILSHRLLQLDEALKVSGNEFISARENLDVINEVFRAAHSIKGASGMLGMANINAITHRMENQLDEIRSGRKLLTAPIIELLFACVNRLETLCDAARINGDGRLTEKEQSFIAWMEETAARCEADIALRATAAAFSQSATSKSHANSQDLTPHVNVSPDNATLEADERPLESEAEGGVPSLQNGSVDLKYHPAEKSSHIVDDSGQHDSGQDEPENGFDMQKYLQLYIDECEEEIESLNHALMTLESDPFSRESINEVFRMAHRIKGSSAAMGFEHVTHLTHEIESIFDDLRSGLRSLDEAVLNVLFRCIDGLRDYHVALRSGEHKSVELSILHAELARVVATPTEVSVGSVEAEPNAPTLPEVDDSSSGSVEKDESSAAPPPFSAAPLQAPEPIDGACAIHIAFQPGLHFVDLKAEVIQTKLKTQAKIISCDPPVEALEGKSALTLYVISDSSLVALSRLVDIDGVRRIELERIASDGSTERLTVGDHQAAPAVTVAAVANGSRESVPNSKSSPAPAALDRVLIPSPPETTVSAVSEFPIPAPVKSAKVESTNSSGLPASEGAVIGGGKVAETVRVEIDRLDHLMNLAGELIINKARFVEIAGGMQSLFQGKSAHFAMCDMEERLDGISRILDGAQGASRTFEDVDLLMTQFSRLRDEFRTVQETLGKVQEGRQQFNSMAEAIHQLSRVADGIQKGVMETRMVPVGPLFVRFKRVIRDIARGAGKEVNLVIGGEKTELDKRMIDELGDPLIHMVRNAVDHGLETPDERTSVGKSRVGTIHLDAHHRGNSVVITVSDDGRGIDANRLRLKLVEKGILSESDAAQMPDKQILNYIWHPGFSTAARITDISGRGVGMDIVKSKIEELNGTVDLKTEVGRGTTFSIRLPLTLAIMPSLLTRICGEVYAMPLEAVEEIVKVPLNEIYSIQGRQTLRVRNKIIGLVKLQDVFSWPAEAQLRLAESKEGSSPRELTVVILQANDIRVGLVVESLLGEEEIVIKSLAHNFVNVRGLAGASILGNGRVSLILDVGVLVDMVSQPMGRDSA